MEVTREQIKQAVIELKAKQVPIIEIINSIMALKGLTQADVARANKVSRATVSYFVNNKKTKSKRLNSYFKRVFFIDVRSMYAMESVKNKHGVEI